MPPLKVPRPDRRPLLGHLSKPEKKAAHATAEPDAVEASPQDVGEPSVETAGPPAVVAKGDPAPPDDEPRAELDDDDDVPTVLRSVPPEALAGIADPQSIDTVTRERARGPDSVTSAFARADDDPEARTHPRYPMPPGFGEDPAPTPGPPSPQPSAPPGPLPVPPDGGWMPLLHSKAPPPGETTPSQGHLLETLRPRASTVPSRRRAWTIATLLIIAAVTGIGASTWLAAGQADRQSQERILEAERQALVGDDESLDAAEQLLSQTGDKVSDADAANVRLLITLQRCLEPGLSNVILLQDALARSEGAAPLLLSSAQATLAALRGRAPDALSQLSAVAASDELRESDYHPVVDYVTGRLSQRVGKPEAMSLLRRAVEARPTMASARLALARALIQDGARDEARATLEPLLGAALEPLEARLLAIAAGIDDDSGDLLAELQRLEPRIEKAGVGVRMVAELTRAELHLRAGDKGQAESALMNASRIEVNDPSLLLALAALEARVGLLEEAKASTLAAVASEPHSIVAKRQLAEIHMARFEAIDAYLALAAIREPDVRTRAVRLDAALAAGDRYAVARDVEALEQQLTAGRTKDTRLRALVLRGRARLGGKVGLVEAAHELLSGEPASLDARRALAEASLALGAPEAVDAARELVSSAPDDADALFLLARATARTDRAGAEATLARARKLAPQHAEAAAAHAQLLVERGAFTEAVEILAAMLAPESPRLPSHASYGVRLRLVQAQLGAGRLDDAGATLDGLPDKAAAAPLAKQVRAELLVARRDHEVAIALLEPLADSDDLDADGNVVLGNARRASGQQEAALDAFGAALQQDRSHPGALVGYAECLVELKQWPRATEALDAAEAAIDARAPSDPLRGRWLVASGRALLSLPGGTPDIARERIERAMSLQGFPDEGYYWLGVAQRRTNDPAAREAFAGYLGRRPEGPLAQQARRQLEEMGPPATGTKP